MVDDKFIIRIYKSIVVGTTRRVRPKKGWIDVIRKFISQHFPDEDARRMISIGYNVVCKHNVNGTTRLYAPDSPICKWEWG